MKTNIRKEAGLLNPRTGEYLELDIFFPSLSLGFEYQDIHHYKSSEYVYHSLESLQQRDELKKELAKQRDITLIIVPCWWDGKPER